MGVLPLILLPVAVGALMWLALRGVRAALGYGPPLLAVARNVVDEGSRKRVATFVFVSSIVFIAVVAWGLDPRDPLLFRIRNLLTYGIGGVVTLGMIMTMVLGCGSVASEFEEKQIYSALTKPVGRTPFLIGKWLGVLLLDGVLLFGAGIHLYAWVELQVRTCEDESEVARARAQVLSPYLDIPSNDATDPETRRRFEEYLPEYATRNSRRREVLGAEAFLDFAWSRFLDERRRISPDQGRTYCFENVRPGPAALHLCARMYPPPLGDQIEVIVQIGDSLAAVDKAKEELELLGVGKTTVIALEEGSEPRSVFVRIQFRDKESESPIDFTELHALEVVQPATNFANNLARTLLIYLVKFGFVAAMAVFAASFLSFPVATLTVALITIVASASDYLITSSMEPGGTLYKDSRGRLTQSGHSHGGSHSHSHSHEQPATDPIDAVLDSIERFGLVIAQALRKYGEVTPTTSLVDGRVVTVAVVGQSILWIGLVWTGSVGVVALVVFRRRELARVQV